MKKVFLFLVVALCMSQNSLASESCGDGQYAFGDRYCLSLNELNSEIRVTDSSNGETLFFTKGGRSIQARKVNTTYKYDRGSFAIKEKVKDTCSKLPYDSILFEDETLTARGKLQAPCKGMSYELKVSLSEYGHLDFDVELFGFPKSDKDLWRASLGYASSADEKYVGFGEQFTEFDMKGKLLPILSQEQGHGRGLQPLTGLMRIVGSSAGDWHTTYASIPQYISNKGRSLYLRNLEYAVFDMRAENYSLVEVDSPKLKLSLLEYGSPLEQLDSYTRYAGRMSPLPSWTQKGAIVCLMGGSDEVRRKLKKLLDAGVPLAGVWIQDWVGQKKTIFGQRMEWNWSLDETSYPDMPELIREIRNLGIEVLAYINPYVADIKVDSGEQRYYDRFAESGFILKRTNGKFAGMDQGGFQASIVDLSNPHARQALKNIIRKNFIDAGMKGWMADFGEAVPFDVVPYSGEDPKTYHSTYIQLWNDLQKEVVEEAGLEGEILVMQRAGIATSPRSVSSFWLGDQLASWDEFDGMQSALNGLLSSSLSGFSINHSDVGGIMEINILIKRIRRSPELQLRWMEMNAFSSLFRTHEGISPWGDQVQVYSNQKQLNAFAKFSEVFKALKPYRTELMREAAETGAPLVRPMLLTEPEQSWAWKSREQFTLGTDLVVAPVLKPETSKVNIHLPEGEWVHMWSGKVHRAPEQGLLLKGVSAPIGEPAAFYRLGSQPEELLKSFQK